MIRRSVSTSAVVGGSSPRHIPAFAATSPFVNFDIDKLPIQTRDLQWFDGENVEGRMLLRLAEQDIASGSPEAIKRVIALMNDIAIDPAAETRDSLLIMRRIAADLRTSAINESLPPSTRADMRSFLRNCAIKLSSKILSSHAKELVVESVGLLAVILPVQVLYEESPDSPEIRSLLPPLGASLAAFWLSPVSQYRHAPIITEHLIKIISMPGNARQGPYECSEQCAKSVLIRLRDPDSIPTAASLVGHLFLIAHEKHDAGDDYSFKYLLKVVGALEMMKSVGWNFADAHLVDVWASSIKCGVKIIAGTFPPLPAPLPELVNAQAFGHCELCNEALLERAKYSHGLSKLEAQAVKWWLVKVARLWTWFCAVADKEVQKKALGKRFESARHTMGWRESISHDHSRKPRPENNTLPPQPPSIPSESTDFDFHVASGSSKHTSDTPSWASSITQSRPSTSTAHIQTRQRVSSASTLASVPEDSEERLEAVGMPPNSHQTPQAPSILYEARRTPGTRQYNPTAVGILSSTSKSNTRYSPIRPSYPHSTPTTPSASRRSKQRAQSNPPPKEMNRETPLNVPSLEKPNPLKRGHPSSSSMKENDRDYNNKRARTSLDLSLMKSPSSRDPSQLPTSSDSLSFFQKLAQLGTRRRKSSSANSATTQPEAVAGPSRIPSLDTSLLPAFNLPEVPATPRRTHDHAACSLYTPQVPGSIYHIEDRLRHDNGWVEGLTKLWFDSTAPAEDVDVRKSQEFVWHSEQLSGDGQDHPVPSTSAAPITNHSIAGPSTEEMGGTEENDAGTESTARILSTKSTPTHNFTRMTTQFFGAPL